MLQAILVFILFVALLLAVLALQNQETMVIRFFFWEVLVPKILVILGSALAGGLAVFLAGLFRRGRHLRREGHPPRNGEASGQANGKAGEKADGR